MARENDFLSDSRSTDRIRPSDSLASRALERKEARAAFAAKARAESRNQSSGHDTSSHMSSFQYVTSRTVNYRFVRTPEHIMTVVSVSAQLILFMLLFGLKREEA